ncbi:MAG: hypothetical protein SO314_07225 [Alphaproteobacteria bacterium]|nr:hypothetical protein [Alphaproteobacteria bacterium]
MSMNISSNYGSYPPIINSSQLSDMKTALQVQEKIAETEKIPKFKQPLRQVAPKDKLSTSVFRVSGQNTQKTSAKRRFFLIQKAPDTRQTLFLHIITIKKT